MLSTDSVASGAVSGGLVCLMAMALLSQQESLGLPIMMVYFLLLLIVGISSFGALMIAQYMTCQSVDAGRALSGTIPSVGFGAVALFLASRPLCRTPIASVVAPLFLSSPPKKCCTASMTLEEAETNVTSSGFPIGKMIKGLSYGFYLWFAVLFGIVQGTSTAVVCA